MRKRLRSLLLRVIVAAVIAWILATMPLPPIAPQKFFAYVQVPIVVFVLVCYIGKLMIDTFFYNHYQP